MSNIYIAPEYGLGAFNCPHCGAYAAQLWLTSSRISSANPPSYPIKDISISRCQLCGEAAIWIEDQSSRAPDKRAAPNLDQSGAEGQNRRPLVATNGRLVYPSNSLAPMPADDMPDEIKSDYMEAREILAASPRGAAALLRLSLQKLMPVLGEKGRNIDDDIAELVKKGLPVGVQKACDSLRVIGNESVHPGNIDLRDDRETALALFSLFNYIVERMITQPKKLNELYSQLPQGKLDAIAKRDGK